MALSSSSSPPFIDIWSSVSFGFPISFLISSINLARGPNTSSAASNAFTISSSANSFASHSTMEILSPSPITTNSRSESSTSSTVGLIIGNPPLIPSLTPPIGPSKGISDMCSAIHAPIIPTISGLFSWSSASGRIIICISFLIACGNSGRSPLSIILPMRTASFDGLPSLLVNLGPFIRPAAKNLSS